jgi:hypothetical protein
MDIIKLNINEITNNQPITAMDVWELSYYVHQTYDRQLVLVRDGYLASEHEFRSDDEGYLGTIYFDKNNSEHLEYANTSLGRNMQKMLAMINAEDPLAYMSADKDMSDGWINPGMDDFIEETISPLLPAPYLDTLCMMESGLNSQLLYRLCIHFCATVKLAYEGIIDVPEFNSAFEIFSSLAIPIETISFRELTLLAGFKTERAIRNLASPSTPEHRRLKVIKEGRLTGIEINEAKRWLAANKK